MTRASAVHRSVPSVGLSSYSSRSCYVSLPSLLRWSPFLAAQFYVLSYRDAFTWEFCQPALPESIAGVIAATNKSPQLKKRRENSKLPQFSLLLFTLPSTNFFILGKWSSRICLGLSWRMMQMWTHMSVLCRVHSQSQASWRWADRGLSPKTCPPSQTKKHSLPQHHGANTWG